MRGKHVTKPMDEVLREARELAADGVRELNLVAQDSTYWGMDLYGKPRLADLLRELDRVDGIEWVRLLYAYPEHVTDDLLAAMATASAGDDAWPAAVGAFLIVAALILLTALVPRLGALIAAIPPSIAQAMLAGVLLPLCLAPVTGLVANPPNAYYSSTKFALEAVTEALAAEVRPLGIKVTAIEPGAFRTDWATRSMKESGSPISDYADVAARKDLIKQFADHLPGDPKKVAEAVLMVTTLDDPPLRLLLGRDVLKAMRDKITAMSASIEEWKAVTKNVNFAES